MEKFKLPLIITAGVVSVILMIVFMINGVQNKAIALEEQVKTANSDIKVQEKRRVDLLYNLADSIKDYNKHESETLKSVVEVRASGKGDISEVGTLISAAVEAYPQLQSNANYKQMMNELSITENMIAQFRSNYNKQVKEYNRYVRKFPNKQYLRMLGYEFIDFTYLDYNAPESASQDLFGE